MPLAADVVEAVAIAHGVCIRPVPMKVTDTQTGDITFVDVPCGATLASTCPPCAQRARRLRVHQCREGWHLDADPDLSADESSADQMRLVIERADATADGDTDAILRLDGELVAAGVRGDIDPPQKPGAGRSTRRRSDVPDLPKLPMSDTTVGRSFSGNNGRVFRPSMFLTLTLPSYGQVYSDGTPRDPGSYDYVRAARDAIGFPALIDRLVQNLRRVAGYDVQYFATVEPQRRLAPHAHFAIRGSIPRKVLRQVVAATYRQVWWPTPGQAVYDEHHRPVWDDHAHGDPQTGYVGGYVDPATGASLTSWVEAMQQLDQAEDLVTELGDGGAEPYHVLKFGSQVDLKGILAGTPEADRLIGYLAKYLTKSMSQAMAGPEDDGSDAAHLTVRQRAHVDRLVAALRVQPCGPGCSNWLRYGITPKNPHTGMSPGSCRSRAHKREHLGYAGRRVLVSRKWTGKTLTDHRHDRRAWVLAVLGINDHQGDSDRGATAGAGRSNDKTRDRYAWAHADPDAQLKPLSHRLLIAINQRQLWQAAYQLARDGKPPPAANLSAISPSASADDPAA